MAGALMGGAFLSASVQLLFDRLASHEVLDFIKRNKLNGELLKRLKITLLSVNAVLDDAEVKQIRNENVKEWLEELKHVVYEAEDLLEEISTEAVRCKIEAKYQTSVTKVQNFFSSNFNPFNKGINSKLEEVLARLNFIAKQKDILGLREGFVEQPWRRVEETSVLDESGVYGRDAEKESVKKLMFSDDSGGYDVGVVAIVGMGGLGKTTLAQLVYNDCEVKEWFSFEGWVCVSEEFDIFRVTKTILQQVTSSTTDIKDLNGLQLKLMEALTGKKFLIVLDDVWNDNYFDWDRLLTPFKVGLRGSKMILTTRNEGVAEVVRTAPTYYLNLLTDDNCWSLFARHAFGNDDSRAQCTPEMMREEVIRRCKGLPLAAKTLGGVLRFKSTPMEWNEILKSDIWDISDSILPVLRISYLHLSSHLKRCFAYCSVLPKDYEFKKEQLIELWVAENLLHQHVKNKTMEEVGELHFRELVSRSLFQRTSGKNTTYVTHDLVHDLAQFVSGEFCFRLEGDNSHSITEKTRHLSYSQTHRDPYRKFEGIVGAKYLRTFLPFKLDPTQTWAYLSNKVLHDLLPMLKCLRAVSLSQYDRITELPESIGNLKYLHMLDLSGTAISRLPDSTATLYNLLTLRLCECKKFSELPADMHKLVNLCHLDLTGTNIKEMPVHIGKLKRLQTLTLFAVGEQSGTTIGELSQLNDLRGNLLILDLQNVKGPMDALEAGVKDKKGLEGLSLEWGASSNDSRKERDVLEKLQPHVGLKELTIKNYGSTEFPCWLADKSLSNVVLLCLSNCKNCISLPSLGQLHSLKELSVMGFDSVVIVGLEFYGSGGSAIMRPFKSLETLRFKDMLEWEEWFPFDEDDGSGAFPCLRQLYLENCPKLAKQLPSSLPSLTELVISECPQLVAYLPNAPTLHHLQLRYCDKILLKDLPPHLKGITLEGWALSDRMADANTCLQSLTVSDCLSLNIVPMDHISTTLETLKVESSGYLKFPVHLYYERLEILLIDSSCHSLRILRLDIFPNIKRLTIKSLPNLESLSLPCRPRSNLKSLGYLRIDRCPKLVSLAEGGLHAPNLTWFYILRCKSLKSLPERMDVHLPLLRDLGIYSCPELVSFPEGGLPCNLRQLSITGSPKLFASRGEWCLQKLTSLRYVKISVECKDIHSFPEEGLLPATLNTLCFQDYPHLISLNSEGLYEITNLKELYILDSPELQRLPDEGLPKSLSLFQVIDCPLLKKRCQGEKGEDWSKISHIPCISIDHNLIP